MQRLANKLKLSAAFVSGALTLAALSGCGHSESTATLMAEAKQYQQKGDLKAALIQLKNAVEKSPTDAEARFQLGLLDMDMRDFVSAEKELSKARSLGIPAERVLPLLGKVYVQQGKFKELLQNISAEQAAKSAPLLALRGDGLIATGKQDEAKQAYDQALALNPNESEALIGLARLAMAGGDRAGAVKYLDDAVAKDPKNPEVWMTRGVVMRMQGRTEDALASYDEALKLKPNHFSAHVEKAYIEIAGGKFPAAKAEIDAAEKISPGNLLVTYTRALYEFSQGNHAAAHDALLKVLKSAPDHLPSILLAGASELSLGSTQQAEQHLRKYLESNPDNLYARKLLAQAQLKSAQPADAAATLAPVLKESIQDPQLLALAGESYMQTHDFDKASNYLEKAAALAPNAAGVRTSLGMAKLAQGQEARGLSELEAATSLDPKSIQAAMALIQTETRLKHYDKALAAAASLEKQQPDNPQVQNIKGAVYVVKGDIPNARAAFEKALTLQPSFFPATVNLARLDVQEKKPDAARQRFERLLEKDKNNAGAMAALGELALSQKRTDEATSWFEKASNVNPDAVAPAITLGAQYLRINQPQKALTLARKLQTANPTNPDVLELMGQAQVLNKDLSGALDTYGKLVNVLPKSGQAQLRLAGVHVLMNNDAAAADDLKRAVDLQPDLIPARLAQVDLALRGHRIDEALALTRKIQAMNEKSPIGFAIEGDVLMIQGKSAQALGAYDKALALSNSPGLLIKSAQALNAAGKNKDAQARLAQWLKSHPDDVNVALTLSSLQLVAKDYKAAGAMLEDLQKRIPNNVPVLNNLAFVYQQLKDPRALPTAEQAYKLSNENPQVADTLAWLLVEQGNTARALPLLQRAVSQAPNAPEIRYHYAVGLQKSGDKQAARKELDKLLAENTTFPQIEEARALLKAL